MVWCASPSPVGDVAHPSLGGMQLTVIKDFHEANLQARAHIHWDLKVHTIREEQRAG